MALYARFQAEEGHAVVPNPPASLPFFYLIVNTIYISIYLYLYIYILHIYIFFLYSHANTSPSRQISGEKILYRAGHTKSPSTRGAPAASVPGVWSRDLSHTVDDINPALP